MSVFEGCQIGCGIIILIILLIIVIAILVWIFTDFNDFILTVFGILVAIILIHEIIKAFDR